jgi:hypothetical protein
VLLLPVNISILIFLKVKLFFTTVCNILLGGYSNFSLAIMIVFSNFDDCLIKVCCSLFCFGTFQ